MAFVCHIGSLLDYFKDPNFIDLDKKQLQSLIALDLSSIPIEKNSTPLLTDNLDINYLDLTSPIDNRKVQNELNNYQDFFYQMHERKVLSTLKNLCQEYEERFFSLTSEYYNAYLLEKRIAGFMELWLNICFRIRDYQKWYVFERVVNLILKNKICSESLALILIKIICFGEMTVPRELFQNYSLAIEFISTNIQKIDSLNQQKIQKLLSVHDALRDGSLEVLTCLIHMGHEYQFEHVLERSCYIFWYPFFIMKKDYLLRIKPEAMPFSRFMLLLHIFNHAKLTYIDQDINTYEQFEEKLQILYMALPYPLITKKEVEKVFEEAFKKLSPSIKEGILEKLDTITQKSSSKPRRLEHLARCTIRKALNCNRMLPGGINELRLPKRMKHYLMLETA